MDLERKRVSASSSRNGVVVGSVWESRMRGSFKVFNGDDKNMNLSQETETPNEKNHPIEKKFLRSKESPNGGKRKTWKSDGSAEGIERNPVQITKVRSENKKILGELSKELSVSIDGIGIKKSPVELKKGRPEWNKNQSDSIDGIERSPVQRIIKTQSLSRKESVIGDSSDGIEKVKPGSTKGIEISDESNNGVQEIEGGNSDDDDDDDEIKKFGVVCEEKLMTVDLGIVKSAQTNDEEHEEACSQATMVEVNEERSIVVVKEMEPISKNNKSKTPDVVLIENKKIQQRNERSNPISRTVRKQPPPGVNHPRTISKPNELPQRSPKSHSKLQSFIDLIMWKDASKSALIFGFGTFSILSSSYTNDLNISFISVISYLGLIYLAAIFIIRSFILRGVVETDNITDHEHVLGEEEAIWAVKLFLPYINEFLLKVKALFSGDPATTMKLAVLLFVLARCGSSITIWKMAKLGFLGVFTVPKICSSYSSQLTAYGTFWVRRFKDAWESCSQKKAVALGVFTFVWNLSSITVRIWAVFMLLVTFKYYQQSMMKGEGVEEEEPVARKNQSSWQERRHGKVPVSFESTKLKKIS